VQQRVPAKEVRPPLPAGLEGVGVEVFLDTDGVARLEGTRTVVKSPGDPREAAVIARDNFEQRGDRFREIVRGLER
jgi:hypothetical protein